MKSETLNKSMRRCVRSKRAGTATASSAARNPAGPPAGAAVRRPLQGLRRGAGNGRAARASAAGAARHQRRCSSTCKHPASHDSGLRRWRSPRFRATGVFPSQSSSSPVRPDDRIQIDEVAMSDQIEDLKSEDVSIGERPLSIPVGAADSAASGHGPVSRTPSCRWRWRARARSA